MWKVLWLAACAAWFGGDECPDQTATPVPADVRSFFMQKCSGGLDLTIHGVRVRTPRNMCPLFVIITPAHAKTRHVRGSGTYTRPEKTMDVRRLDFKCEDHWLLGLIPIAISSSCQKTGEKKTGGVTHYVQFPCPPEPGRIEDGV